MLNLFKKKPQGTTVTFKISGMHCTSCSMNIDGALEDTPGVISASTSYAKSTTTVEYDPLQTSKQKLLEVIKNLEYSVEESSE